MAEIGLVICCAVMGSVVLMAAYLAFKRRKRCKQSNTIHSEGQGANLEQRVQTRKVSYRDQEVVNSSNYNASDDEEARPKLATQATRLSMADWLGASDDEMIKSVAKNLTEQLKEDSSLRSLANPSDTNSGWIPAGTPSTSTPGSRRSSKESTGKSHRSSKAGKTPSQATGVSAPAADGNGPPLSMSRQSSKDSTHKLPYQPTAAVGITATSSDGNLPSIVQVTTSRHQSSKSLPLETLSADVGSRIQVSCTSSKECTPGSRKSSKESTGKQIPRCM